MENDVVGAVVGGLLWLGGGLVFKWIQRYCSREIDEINSARKVSSLKDLVKNPYPFGYARHETPRLVALEGRVNADTTLNCRKSKLSAVILEESLEQFFLKQVNGSTWVKDSAFLGGFRQEVPWFVEDGSGRVYIEGAQDARGLTLVVASDVIEDSKPGNSVQALADLAHRIRVLCWRRIERVLPVGTVLTVVGEATRVGNDRVVIRKPHHGPFFVTTKSLKSIVSDLGASSSWCGLLAAGCTAVGLLTLGVQGYRFVMRRMRAPAQRPEARRSGNQQISEDQVPGQPSDRGDGDSTLAASCVICLDRQYDVAFFPCGHVCCCKVCSEGLPPHCPLCRQRIQEKKLVFLH